MKATSFISCIICLIMVGKKESCMETAKLGHSPALSNTVLETDKSAPGTGQDLQSPLISGIEIDPIKPKVISCYTPHMSPPIGRAVERNI